LRINKFIQRKKRIFIPLFKSINTMNYTEYTQLFDHILSTQNPPKPYDNPDYLNYTKLNDSRMRRWMKTGNINQALTEELNKLQEPQLWIIISEPWCGDASHVVPFLIKISELSQHISYEIQLRDSEPFLINSYLTNGGKSIPKLIARDKNGEDLFTWGPRPHGAKELMNQLNEQKADFETVKIELQNWYNADKGQQIQQEIYECLKTKNS